MEKRFQVFISSTYADLKDERAKVIQTIMEMDCIPAVMEIFPAIDEEQFNFIKRVIDDCDYYILIIGGRYGSLSDDGLSYTEKEFDYANKKGIKIIVFIHSNPNKLSVEKSDIAPAIKEKLDAFRKKASTGRLVKYWEKPEELPSLVALSLQKTIKIYPAVGWVRSNKIGNSELLIELNDLRKENSILKEKIQEETSRDKPITEEELAGLNDKYIFKGSYSDRHYVFQNWKIEITWKELFYILSPFLMKTPSDDKVNKYLALQLIKKLNLSGTFPIMEEEVYQTLKIHLEVMNLIQVTHNKSINGGIALFWKLTDEGRRIMKKIRSVKK
ncbi:DUF4062 domain-containing protein [Tenacibaculum sp. UWU-22]|uniref:DUF4062 domain-containing protein n=1 Tax=Tenacibaculum sp. UWU-22 TaxID=3234187 RepID=UPI0034DB1AA6